MQVINKHGTNVANCIIFYSIPAYGHLNPALPVVMRLVKEGYVVICYSTSEFKESITACGALFREYDFGDITFSPQVGSQLLRLSELILQFTSGQLEVLLTEAEEYRPVLVLHDTLAFWGRAVSSILHIKAVSINAIITTFHYFDKAFWMYALGFTGSTIRELAILPSVIQLQRQLKKRYPLKKTSLLHLLMNREGRNIFTYPAVLFPGKKKNTLEDFFLGSSAILRMEKGMDNEDYAVENLVYVSMGTVFNDCFDFYRTIFADLGNTKYTVIISCGECYDTLSGWKVPKNIRLKRYVNQFAVFQYTRLFITAGGMNSICEAAGRGIPCLLYPRQGEQAINSRMFEREGLGVIWNGQGSLLEACETWMNLFLPDADKMKEFSTVYMEELMDFISRYIKEN